MQIQSVFPTSSLRHASGLPGPLYQYIGNLSASDQFVRHPAHFSGLLGERPVSSSPAERKLFELLHESLDESDLKAEEKNQRDLKLALLAATIDAECDFSYLFPEDEAPSDLVQSCKRLGKLLEQDKELAGMAAEGASDGRHTVIDLIFYGAYEDLVKVMYSPVHRRIKNADVGAAYAVFQQLLAPKAALAAIDDEDIQQCFTLIRFIGTDRLDRDKTELAQYRRSLTRLLLEQGYQQQVSFGEVPLQDCNPKEYLELRSRHFKQRP